jgi:hypothetical protein
MATQALERGADGHGVLKSMLLQWQAIAIINLKGSREEAGRLFQKALEAAPDNEYAKANLRRFMEGERDEGDEEKEGVWKMPNDAFLRLVSTPELAPRFANPDRNDAHVMERLAGVGS